MSKFNLKLAGQYSNNLTNLIGQLLINPYSDRDNLFNITEHHQKSKIQISGNTFEDEDIKREKSGIYKDLTLEKRVKLIEELSAEKCKIDAVISSIVKETKIKSEFTGEEVDVDMAKQENVLYKSKVLGLIEMIAEIKDEKQIGVAKQSVGFGDSITEVPYPVEVEKVLSIDRKVLEEKRIEILNKLDRQSMEIDKVKTNSEFDFNNKYDIRVTLNKLVLD